MGAGCPICANDVAQAGYNDLATLFPAVAAEWHPTKNGNLTPSQVVPCSHQTVWWICPEGHVWRTVISNRTNAKKRTGCTVRTGTVRQTDRHLHLSPPAESDRQCG